MSDPTFTVTPTLPAVGRVEVKERRLDERTRALLTAAALFLKSAAGAMIALAKAIDSYTS